MRSVGGCGVGGRYHSAVQTNRSRIAVGGGGSAEDEAGVLSRFASFVGRGARVLYIPWAMPDPAEPRLSRWATSALLAHGIGEVVTASDVRPLDAEFGACGGAFLGGGNTYLLLHRLRETGVGARLVERAREGMPCYGGSAGAIVLGAHIGTCAHMDSNDVGLEDLRGLDLLGGLAVWCHYRANDAPKISEFVNRTGIGVISLAEDSGLALTPEGIAAIGPGEVRKWTPGAGPI